MPNKTMYIDEKTNTKALKALFGEGALDFGTTIAAIERLENAGIYFAEEAESKPRGPRTKADGTVDTDEPADFPVGDGNPTPNLPVQ